MAKAKKIRVGARKGRNIRRRGTWGAWLDRIDELVRATTNAGAPLPNWMPEWVRQKAIDSQEVEPDVEEEVEEVVRKLEDRGTFQRMEAAGGFPLCG